MPTEMKAPISTDDQKKIKDCILKTLSSKPALKKNIEFIFVGAKLKDDYLYVPVRITANKSTWERAKLLQKLEDAWNDQSHPAYRLVLVPEGANIELIH